MTVSEAFEVLGLPEDADAKAIKRAYHKLLRRFKPDRDPEGFRRLRDAFELVSGVRPTVTEASPGPAAPQQQPPSPTVDPAVVHDAIAQGKIAWAHALVIDHRWAHAMLDDPDGALRWATRRVGLATVLEHRPAYDQLLELYPDVFRADDPALGYLLAVSREWVQLDARSVLPRAVRDFITQLPANDGERRVALARGLARWFWSDLETAERFLAYLWTEFHDLGPFLMTEVHSFDEDLEHATGRVPLPPEPTPRRLVRWEGVWVQRALLLPFVVLIATSFPAALPQRLLVAAAVGGLGWFVIRHPSAEDRAKQRAKLLRACLFHDVPPAEVAASLRWDPKQRKRIASDVLLDACYHIGRLARLGLDDPNETRPRRRRRARA